MRKSARMVLVLVIASVIWVFVPMTAKAEVITLKGLRPWPLNDPLNTSYRELLRRINEEGRGRVMIQDMGGAEISPPADQLKLVKRGVVDILFTAPYVVSDFPEMDMCFATFGATPMELREKGILEYFDRKCRERNGVAVIGMPSYLRLGLYLKKPIKTLDDLRGLKIRGMSSYNPVLKELGMATVATPPAEMYTALQTGVVDGIAYTFLGFAASGGAEAAKFIVLPPFWICSDLGLFVNVKKLDSLPADVKDLLLRTAKDLDRDSVDLYNKAAEVEWKTLKEKFGAQEINLTEKEWLHVQDLERIHGFGLLKKTLPDTYTEFEPLLNKTYPPSKELMKLPWK